VQTQKYCINFSKTDCHKMLCKSGQTNMLGFFFVILTDTNLTLNENENSAIFCFTIFSLHRFRLSSYKLFAILHFPEYYFVLSISWNVFSLLTSNDDYVDINLPIFYRKTSIKRRYLSMVDFSRQLKRNSDLFNANVTERERE